MEESKEMIKKQSIVNNADNTNLPATAVPVCVTNIFNPYMIRIYETENYSRKLNVINAQLFSFEQRDHVNTKNGYKEPSTGDSVIVHNKLNYEKNIPSWRNRGVIEDFNRETDKYNIFLVDYGISLKLSKNDFVVIPPDLIPNEPVTMTIGIYNVIPTVLKKTANTNTVIIIENWTDSAINFTRELISTSDTIYFNQLATDNCGNKYGDLYLTVNNEIIVLSESLIVNGHAICLEEELTNFVENSHDIREKGESDDSIVFIRQIENVTCNTSNEDTSDNYKTSTESSIIDIRGTDTRRWRKGLRKWKVDINEIVLIYSVTKLECVVSVPDAKFATGVHKAWDTHVRSSRPKRIQSCMWPAIMRGLNVVAIGPSHSGKTYGYTAAVSGLLAEQKNIPTGNKPSALILCSSSTEVVTVHSLCMLFLEQYNNINAVAAYNGKPERSLSAEIYNGCQILVTTPCFLLRLLNKARKLLNFENLRYLVFDSADVIFDKYNESIRELLVKHKLIANRERNNGKPTLQMIMIGRCWTLQLAKFVPILERPHVCIGSFIEAFIFKNMHLNMILMNSRIKNDKVLDLLGNEYKHSKTVIICTIADEAENLNAHISQRIETLLAHERMNLIKLKGLKECWEACVLGFYPVLICTDDVLSDLNITDVDWLIHYSVSLSVKSHFNFRFCVLTNNLRQEQPNCKVTVIVDENNDLQFQSIVGTMKRMRCNLPEDLLKNAEYVLHTLDKNKKSFPLCHKVKALGFCPNKSSCIFRHCILPEIDAPVIRIKIGDNVKFVIMHLHDATHFTARIIEYVDVDTGEIKKLGNEDHVKIFAKMQKFYGDVENRKRHAVVNVGDICALEEPVYHFQRVQVLCMRTKSCSYFGNVDIADVRCIDSGIIFYKVNVKKLLSIPNELSQLPLHVVELFLTNIAPYDDEYSWSHCTNDAVSSWFKENIYENCYVSGTVCLHLGNTVWVDTLKIGTKIIGYPDLVESSLKTELITKNYAIEKKEHIKYMYDLCKKGGLIEINGRFVQGSMDETVE